MECWRDVVPVGVIRQIQDKSKTAYQILGLAIVAGWDGGYFFLEGIAADGHFRRRGPTGEVQLILSIQEKQLQELGSFDANGTVDDREHVLAQIVRRRGQPEFRRALIQAYDGRCAISSCNAVDALEAAHILPYRGPDTNHASNGLLLRADLHALFDLGLVAVDTGAMILLVAPEIARTSYSEFAGTRIHLPRDPSKYPSIEALNSHRQWSGL